MPRVATLALLFVLVACGEQEWHHHVSGDGKASADFPDEPTPEMAKASGGGTRIRYELDQSDTGYLFAVGADDPDTPWVSRIRNVEAELAKEGYEVLRNTRNECGEVVCYDLELVNKERKALLTMRMAAANGSIYRVVGESFGRESHHPDVRRFLASFQVKK